MTKFLITRLIRFTGADRALLVLFNSLFSLTPVLIKQVGIIPVAGAIFRLYRWLASGHGIDTITTLARTFFNPVVFRDFSTIIFPTLKECLQSKKSVLLLNFFRLYTGTFFIGLIRPILTTIFRYSFGIIFSSLGVVFNEALSGITVIKWIADKVLSIFPAVPFVNNLISQIKGVGNISKPTSNRGEDVSNIDFSSIISTIGLILIGAGAIFLVILVGDYYLPDFTRNIPGVETILNSWYAVYDYLMSWIYTGDTPPRAPSTPDSDIKVIGPEPVSRTNSGSSSGSDTAGYPTPTPTRPGTPRTPDAFPSSWGWPQWGSSGTDGNVNPNPTPENYPGPWEGTITRPGDSGSNPFN